MNDSLLSWGPYVHIKVTAYGDGGKVLKTPMLTCNNYGGNPGPVYIVRTVAYNDTSS